MNESTPIFEDECQKESIQVQSLQDMRKCFLFAIWSSQCPRKNLKEKLHINTWIHVNKGKGIIIEVTKWGHGTYSEFRFYRNRFQRISTVVQQAIEDYASSLYQFVSLKSFEGLQPSERPFQSGFHSNEVVIQNLDRIWPFRDITFQVLVKRRSKEVYVKERENNER